MKGIRDRGYAKYLISLGSLALLIAGWQLAASSIGLTLILPSPLAVVREFLALLGSIPFAEALAGTFLRGLAAFFASSLLGIALGFASGRSPAFEAALAPLMTIIKATPVLAIILLALLWFPAGFVPIFAAFLMAFPVMVGAGSAGARASPGDLLEMARLFKVAPSRVLWKLRMPAALPHLLSGARSALGLCWKVVVAGEVLSQPLHAIGTGMQSSRVLLETPRVFAWALSAILLCGLSEWLFGLAIASRKADAL